MSAEIAELRAEVARLDGLLRDAKKRLSEAEIAAAEFQVDDVVEAYKRGVWRPAIVRRVEPHSFSHVWYRVSFATKGGEWSKQVVWVAHNVRRTASAA